MVETVRSAALFAGPALATAAAERALHLPLVVGAGAFALAAVLSPVLSPALARLPEEPHAAHDLPRPAVDTAHPPSAA